MLPIMLFELKIPWFILLGFLSSTWWVLPIMLFVAPIVVRNLSFGKLTEFKECFVELLSC